MLTPTDLDGHGERAFYRRLIVGARLCEAGYERHAGQGLGPAFADLWQHGWNHEFHITHGSAALSAFASHDGKHLVLCPLGTNDPGDWKLANLPSIWRVQFPWAPSGVRYGVGFLWQLTALRQALVGLPDFQELYDECEHLHLVGHSLGGILATGLRASLDPELYPKPATVITYGCPRGWNKAGAEWYEGNFGKRRRDLVELGNREPTGHCLVPATYSVRHTPGGIADLITRVPPGRWGAHGAGLPVVVSESSVEVGEFAWQAVRRRERVGHFQALRELLRLRRSIGAHKLSGTIRDLEAAERRIR